MWGCSVPDGDIHIGGWIVKSSQYIDYRMNILWHDRYGCFDPCMCGGYQRCGGVIIFQVWIGVTARILIWSQLFQLSKKFLGVILLGSCGGESRGYVNGINIKVGCCNSGVGIIWVRVCKLLLL